MFRFITTIFFIMMGFFIGRLTADEFKDAKEESVTSALLEHAYVITAYPDENPEQNHKNMLLAAGVLRKMSQAKAAAQAKVLPVQQAPLQQEEPEVVNSSQEIIDLP